MRNVPAIALLLLSLTSLSMFRSVLASTTPAAPPAGGATADGGNGYVLSFTGMHQIASTRRITLDAQLEQINKLDNNFTIMLWARFHFLFAVHVHFMIGHKDQGNFMQPFGGWEFGGVPPDTVTTTNDTGKGWHHYAVSWDQTSGNRMHYVDGVRVATSTAGRNEKNWIYKNAYISIGNCYPSQFVDEETYSDCNPSHRFNGELDDIAVFSTVLTPVQVQEHMRTLIMDASREADLVFFWDFENVPAAEADTFRYVPNRGTAGRDYDLRLGGMPKQNVFGRKYTVAGSRVHEIIAPRVVPSQEWRSKPLSKAAPIVVVAAPGMDLSSQVTAIAGGGDFSYRTPDDFNITYINATAYWNAEVHIVPQEKPVVPAHELFATGSEDQVITLQIYSFPQCGPATYKITKMPAKGTLYDLGSDKDATKQKNITQNTALSTTEAVFVLYKPHENQFGMPFDSFEYTATDGLAVSEAVTVSISIVAKNDRPKAIPTTHSMMEDDAGILIPVLGSDIEEGLPLELMVASAGEGTIAQYLDAVTKVSSFWGNPPSVAYHPVTIIGPPDCTAYGECRTAGDWVDDNDKYPPPQQRVLHVEDHTRTEGLFAYVMGHDEVQKTVDIEYHTMYKAVDGKLSPCVMSDPAELKYPDDCKLYDTLDAAIKNPVTKRVKRTVSRANIKPTKAAVWCPLNQNLVGNRTMKGGGAFGPNFVYVHNQADIYRPATEYIEATVSNTVYPILVEVGMPRGMGAVVGIKAKNPASGQWVSLYSGKALKDEAAGHAETRTYWTWAPQSCRVHFKTNQFRIEMDTSAETGIGDWNYIDYVKVYGAESLQPAALPHGTKTVVYVPDSHANGADTFEYRSSDCPGDLFRFSSAAMVDLSIKAVNDAPVASTSYKTMFTDERMDVELEYHDVDNEPDDLIVKFIEAEGTQVEVATDGTTRALQKGTKLHRKPTHLSVLSGGSDGTAIVKFSVADPAGLTATGQLVITINSRPSSNLEIIAVLGSVVGIALLIGSFQTCRYLKAAIEAKKAYQAYLRDRVRKAVQSGTKMQASCYLVTFETFKQMGGLQPHEVVRDTNWFKVVDTYEDLVKLVRTNSIVFISHQWASWEHPDPDDLQYSEMVQACQHICNRNGFEADQLYVFLDYFSIPQKNFTARLAAINTLGIFSSLAPFFVVVAPDAIHKDTKASMNKASYQRRGWCRLEQWGHMCMQGMDNMFWYDGKVGKLKCLGTAEEVEKEAKDKAATPSSKHDWFLDSILVFEGDYTNPDNKEEMVDVVLGLYAIVVNRKDGVTKTLDDLIRKHYKRVFPEKYCHDLPRLLEKMMDSDVQLSNQISSALQFDSPSQPDTSSLIQTQGRKQLWV